MPPTKEAFVTLGQFFGLMSPLSKLVDAMVRVFLVLTCVSQRKGEGALPLLEHMKCLGVGEGVNASSDTLAYALCQRCNYVNLHV